MCLFLVPIFSKNKSDYITTIYEEIVMKAQRTLVIVLAGPIASGKTTIAKLLEKHYGFVYLRRKDTLIKLLKERGEPINENTLQAIGQEVIEKIGGTGLTA